MKKNIFKTIPFILISTILILFSCKSDKKDDFNVEISQNELKIDFFDVNEDFYGKKLSIQEFNKKYPNWFSNGKENLTDADLETFRKDSLELKINQEIKTKINHTKLKKDLNDLFLHIKHYFPKFKIPKIYLFSSVLQSYEEPIIYNREKNTLLILGDCFLGNENKLYFKYGIEPYFQKTMSEEFIVPKVSYSIAESLVPFDGKQQEFLNHLVFNGKLILLQNAFLPKYQNHLKIVMTTDQFKWCEENEFYIWNYFIENELVFSDDSQLIERFINFGPFSKFFLEIDNESPSGVGIFIGSKIVNQYYLNSGKSIQEVLINPNYREIFQESKYKPTDLGN